MDLKCLKSSISSSESFKANYPMGTKFENYEYGSVSSSISPHCVVPNFLARPSLDAGLLVQMTRCRNRFVLELLTCISARSRYQSGIKSTLKVSVKQLN